MTRGFPSRPVLSAALVLTLLMSVIGTAYVSRASAEPSQETASSSVSITNSLTSPADEGPSPRFGFNSVLDQATTTVSKVVCPSVGNCAGGTSSVTLAPGQLVDFLVTVVPGPGFPNGSFVTVADFWTNGLIFQSADNCGPSAITGPTPPGFNNQTFCAATVQNGIVQVVMHFSAATNVTVPSTALNEACVGAPSFTGSTICSSPAVTINFAGPTNTPTPTATPTRTNTPTATPTVGAPPTPGASGTPGLNCANTISQVCTVGGAVTFTWTKTGSGTFTATATGPANSLVGAQPTIFIPTTANANGESFLCNATSAALTTSCSGTTVGDPLCGATITVAFPLVGGGFGNVTGSPITGPNCPGGAANTLIVCKTITLGPGGLGGVGGIGGIGGVGGIGGIGGIGGGLSGLSGTTVSFTASPSSIVIPSITIPPGSLGPVCTSAIPVTVGTAVTITETVPAGFTLQSVTGATLSGNTATLTIVAGANTVTFVNAVSTVIIPNNLPLLPPPPLQFIPPPPPPLLPPPPPAPMAGARAPAGFPEVPVIPEADSLFLVVGGLVALGGLVGLRSLRRRRADDA